MGTPYPTNMFVRHMGSTTGERCVQTGFQVSPIFRHQAPLHALWLHLMLKFYTIILGYFSHKRDSRYLPKTLDENEVISLGLFFSNMMSKLAPNLP